MQLKIQYSLKNRTDHIEDTISELEDKMEEVDKLENMHERNIQEPSGTLSKDSTYR